MSQTKKPGIVLTMSCYLVISGTGIRKMTKSQPQLDAGEIAVRVNLKIPRAVFESPSFTANFEVDDDQVINHEMQATVSGLGEVLGEEEAERAREIMQRRRSGNPKP